MKMATQGMTMITILFIISKVRIKTMYLVITPANTKKQARQFSRGAFNKHFI